MTSAAKYRLVFVTAPDRKTARKLALQALRARLVACVNLLPQIESHYWWRGKIEDSTEVLMILKTRAASIPGLEKLILAGHPYDTPEFLVLELTAGNRRYLRWLHASTKAD